MKKELRILIVEDSENDALLTMFQIKKGGYDVYYERVETAGDLKAALHSKKWDIILSDFKMPGFNGREALSIVKESDIDIPFIIISGTIGEDVAVETMKAGAHDYIMKDNLHRLLPAVEREIAESKNRAKQRRLEHREKLLQKERLLHFKLLKDLDKVNRAIQGTNDLEQVMSNVLDEVLEIFDCDRAFLMYPCNPGAKSWNVPMERHKPEYPGVLALGIDMPMQDDVAKSLHLLLNTDGVVKFGPGTNNTLPENVSEQFKFKCFMSMAIYPKTGDPWQFGIHQCSHVRQWKPEEERLMQEIGRRLADALTGLLVLRDLKESEQKFSSAFQFSPSALSVISLKDFIYLDVNNKLLQKTGYAREEIIGHSMSELNLSAKPEQRQKFIELVNQQGSVHDFEYEFQRKDKSTGMGSASAACITIGGKPCLITQTIDITERKKAEEKLQISEQKYRTLAETIPDNIIRYDINGRVIYMNCNVQETINTKIDEFRNLLPTERHRDTLPKGVYDEYERNLFEVLNTGKLIEFEFLVPDLLPKEVIHLIKMIAERDETGTIIGAMAIGRDITERKIAEKELIKAKEKAEENEQKLLTFINSIPDIICYKDANGNWLLANEADLDLFCLKGVDYFGKNDLQLSEFTAELYKEAFINCMESDEIAWNNKAISKGIEIIPTVKGVKKVYDVYKVPVFYSNGERKGLAVIGRDITKLYETQESLIAAKEKAEENDRLKTAFLQNMSHEIRTPLNAICGFSEILDDPDLSTEKRRNFTSIIQSSSLQLLAIVTDILTISSIETKQVKLSISKVCINNVIVDLLSVFKQQSLKQKVLLYAQKELTDFQSEILTDKTKIIQIFSNLLSNAFKFTHEGFIEFGYTLKTDVKPYEIVFYVKDSGIGIKPEMHEKIFERFLQADKSIQVDYGGTGLGLSISKGFVELLGGKIWVQSEPTKGATFYFTIPYNPANKTDKTISPITQNKNFKTVLVVEDEVYNFLLIEELLCDIDLKLIYSKNGKEAVDICKANPKIDLVLMDIKIPIMTGDTAAKLIKGFRPDLAIIALSGYTLQFEIEKFSGIFDGFLTKPINGDILKEIVLKFISKK